jgi:hypothetical protein
VDGVVEKARRVAGRVQEAAREEAAGREAREALEARRMEEVAEMEEQRRMDLDEAARRWEIMLKAGQGEGRHQLMGQVTRNRGPKASACGKDANTEVVRRQREPARRKKDAHGPPLPFGGDRLRCGSLPRHFLMSGVSSGLSPSSSSHQVNSASDLAETALETS